MTIKEIFDEPLLAIEELKKSNVKQVDLIYFENWINQLISSIQKEFDELKERNESLRRKLDTQVGTFVLEDEEDNYQAELNEGLTNYIKELENKLNEKDKEIERLKGEHLVGLRTKEIAEDLTDKLLLKDKEWAEKIGKRIKELEIQKTKIENDLKIIENTKCPACGKKVTFGASGNGKLKYGCYNRECPRVKDYNYFYVEFWLPPLWEVENKLKELKNLMEVDKK